MATLAMEKYDVKRQWIKCYGKKDPSGDWSYLYQVCAARGSTFKNLRFWRLNHFSAHLLFRTYIRYDGEFWSDIGERLLSSIMTEGNTRLSAPLLIIWLADG